MKVLLVGGGAREHAIGDAVCRSGGRLVTVSHNNNPGLFALSEAVASHDERDVAWIRDWARQHSVDLAIIGLEDPLEVGLPDALWAAGIPTVGPRHCGAQLETSKLFTRDLMRSHDIPGGVEYRYFDAARDVERFLRETDRAFVLKPLGLTAGKGVKVMGEHLDGITDAVAYAEAVIRDGIGDHHGLILEERLVGEEFTLQCFVDGRTVVPMPLVQDYKRAFDGDRGPNTGSMGSYSQPDGLLPFLDSRDRDRALEILRRIIEVVAGSGCPYQGILYGQFMMTADGIRVVELNARFGDPEAVNVLPLLKTNFLDVCQAIVESRLDRISVEFDRKATVCKYIAPPGYGEEPRAGVALELDLSAIEHLGVRVFYAKVNANGGPILTTTSRAVALVGIADDVDEAERAVERALTHVRGEYHVRHDIGTAALRNRRWTPADQRAIGVAQ